MSIKLAFFLTMYVVVAAFAGVVMYVATQHHTTQAEVVYTGKNQ